MNITSLQAEKILKGNHAFKQLGFSMLITRLKGLYAKDPSQATMQTCITEINAFLGKFNTIMGEDFNTIRAL